MNIETYAEMALAEMFSRASAQFGDAVKSRWLYNVDTCPGCGFEIDAMKFKGKEALSLNAFIYRERGVLIGYMLCGRCAGILFEAAEKTPGKETSRHAVIETNLIKGYKRYILSLDA